MYVIELGSKFMSGCDSDILLKISNLILFLRTKLNLLIVMKPQCGHTFQHTGWFLLDLFMFLVTELCITIFTTISK